MTTKRIKILWKKFLLRYLDRFTSPLLFTQILQMEGIEVGDHTIFYGPSTQNIDRQRPWMLKIGDYCKITNGVTILTHDYSRSVLRMKYGDVIGEAGCTEIGNNVFVGVNATILMGSKIGDNVIIGAGSVVSGVIPSDVVVAGNPAKIIKTLDEHRSIRKKKTVTEAFVYFNSFVKKYKREPSISEMGPFFPLFLKRDKETLLNSGVNLHPNGDNNDNLISSFLNSAPPIFATYEDFKIKAKQYE